MVPCTCTAPVFDGDQGVRDAQTDVVVRVDADGAVQFAERDFRDFGNFDRQAAAVRVAEHDHVRARLFGRLPGGDGVFGVELVAVEAMLGVVNDKLAVVLEKLHGVADHRQIFLRRAAQDFLHVQHGGLAENGHDGRRRLDEQAHLIILFDRHSFFARGAERGEPGVLEFFLFRLGKKLNVLGIAAGPAAFNVMNPERVELLGDAELVRHREIDAFALEPSRRVVS